MGKVKSEKSAIANVKRFFSNSPNDDVITLQDAFVAWGRPEPKKIEKHKHWLSNKMTSLAYLGLIHPVYSYETGHKRIVGLKLTKKGKIALGRIENPSAEETVSITTPIPNGNGNKNKISIAEAMDIVEQLREKYKDAYEIVFDVKLKAVKG